MTLPQSIKDWWYGPLPPSLVCMGREREEQKGKRRVKEESGERCTSE
jgi:hypothetical protein